MSNLWTSLVTLEIHSVRIRCCGEELAGLAIAFHSASSTGYPSLSITIWSRGSPHSNQVCGSPALRYFRRLRSKQKQTRARIDQMHSPVENELWLLEIQCNFGDPAVCNFIQLQMIFGLAFKIWKFPKTRLIPGDWGDDSVINSCGQEPLERTHGPSRRFSHSFTSVGKASHRQNESWDYWRDFTI